MNPLCNLSHKKSQEVAASLPGRFLSRHCFTLCTTMEVEPRVAKQYKCHHCCSCKNYQGKGMEGGKKCLFIVFWLTRSGVHGKNAFWGILQHKQQVIACCQTHSDYEPPNNACKADSVKFANLLSLPSIVKKVRTGSKSSQGT